MDYKKIYDQLVERCKVRGLDRNSVDYYTEIHHIVPRCLGGSDEKDNLVMFSGREHFIAHMLLWKAYPDEVSLMRAAFMMSSRWGSGRLEESKPIHSKTYATLREEYAEAVKEQVTGENNPFFGKTHTDETREKIKAWHAANPEHARNAMKGRKHTPEAIAKMQEFQRNRPPMSAETRKKIGDFHRGKPKNPESYEITRQANIGRKMTDETKAKISKATKGRKWTQAQREGITASLKYGEEHHSYGIPKSDDTKQKISLALKSKNQRPWENPTCQNFTDLSKWALADYYYEIWCYFDRPGLKKLKKIYDYINNDDITLSLLAVMRINFSKGWVPEEDDQWVSFRDSYMEV